MWKNCTTSNYRISCRNWYIYRIYPDNWKGLDFEQLKKISEVIGDIGVVLHGGTGIPDDQIKKA
ncbi:MAG: class II fructose-bisphosphate aldolase, partial [Malacoplasma sp.]|nr:class II fructose-bisphosphate aldolase [Malacoplasma sp.]